MRWKATAQRWTPTAVTEAALTVRSVRRAGYGLPLRSAFAAWVRAARLNDLPPGLLVGHINAVDVGAHVGDWTAALLRLPQTRQVVAIEPTPTNAEALVVRFASDPRVRVETVAAGAEHGSMTLRLATQSNFNSMLPLAGEINTMYDGVAEVGTAKVTVRTLDNLLADLPHITLLKIDVQGSEPAVLAGAQDVLARTACVLIECQFRSHYTGDALIWDLNPLLVDAGFSLFRMSPPVTGPDGSWLWADGVYVRQQRYGAKGATPASGGRRVHRSQEA